MITEAARDYYEKDNWNVIPIGKDSKRPKAGTDKTRILLFPQTKKEVEEYFPEGKDDRNIAVACGPVSGWRNNLSTTVIDVEQVFVKRFLQIVETNPILNRIYKNTRVSNTPHGGKHIFIKSPHPISTMSISDEDNNNHIMDIQAFKSYVLVPPSKIDNQYLWDNGNEKNPVLKIEQDELVEVIKLLTKRSPDIVTQEKISEEIIKYYNKQQYLKNFRNSLPNRLFCYLQNGYWPNKDIRTKDGKKDRSRIEWHIMYRLASLGFDAEAIYQFFTLYAYNGSKFKTNPAELNKYTIEKVIKEYNANRSDFDRRCDELLSKSLLLTDLKTYEGSVLTTILSICKRVGRFTELRLSQTELAEMNATSQNTIHRYLKSLSEKGIITKVKNSDGSRATIYSVNEQRINKINYNTYTVMTKPIGIIDYLNYSSSPYNNKENLYENNKDIKLDISFKDLQDSSNDIFFRSGLGKIGYKIVILFNKNIGIEFDSKTIAEIVNSSTPTVNTKLDDLVKHGYVLKRQVPTKRRPKNIYWIEEQIKGMYELTEEKGLVGKAEQHKQKIKEQRRNYKEYCESTFNTERCRNKRKEELREELKKVKGEVKKLPPKYKAYYKEFGGSEEEAVG